MLQGQCLCEGLFPDPQCPSDMVGAPPIPVGGQGAGDSAGSCFRGEWGLGPEWGEKLWAHAYTWEETVPRRKDSVFCSSCEAVPESGLMPASGRV